MNDKYKTEQRLPDFLLKLKQSISKLQFQNNKT